MRAAEVATAEALVAIAAVVLVPLALPLVHAPTRSGAPRPIAHIARRAVEAGGLSLAAALALRGTSLAPFLALPWLFACVAVAAASLDRALARPRWRIEESLLDLGGLYLPVGGVWAAAYVADVPIAGFAGTQQILTAAHFHYAGFGACVVIGLLGRALGGRWRRVYAAVATAHGSGVALVAIGITFSHLIEQLAAWLVAAAFVSAGLLLAGPATRSLPPLPRALLRVAGVVTLGSGALAAHFSLGGFGNLGADRLARMVFLHGVPNAIGFVLLSVIAFRLAPPVSRANVPGAPWSRLRSPRLTVGKTYFAREGLVDQTRTARGLMDDFAVYGSDLLDTTAVSATVQRFYTHTDEFELTVQAQWSRGFRRASELFRAVALRVGQLALPSGSTKARPIESHIIALRASRDGRDLPRGWLRSYADGAKETIYVATYSSHVHDGRRFMNIAFPLPFANMTSVLLLENTPEPGGLSLTSLARDGDPRDGDQGVYIVTALGVLRLPLDETIRVFPEEDGCLSAVHDMWLFGVPYLRLTYWIEPDLRAANSVVSDLCTGDDRRWTCATGR